MLRGGPGMEQNTYFGFWLLDCDLEIRRTLNTDFATTLRGTKMVLIVNPDKADAYPDHNMRAHLKHEVMHQMLMHVGRGKKFTSMVMTPAGPMPLWNLATDMAINSYIEDMAGDSVKLPEGWEQYQTADFYYAKLLQKAKDDLAGPKGKPQGSGKPAGGKPGHGQKPSQGQSGGQGGNPHGGKQQSGSGAGTGPSETNGGDQGNVLVVSEEDARKFGIEAQKWWHSLGHPHDHSHLDEPFEGVSPSVAEQVIKAKAKAAMQYAKDTNSWGNMPGSVKELIEGILKPKVKWWREFRNFWGHYVAKGQESTRSRPNRRLWYEAPGRIPRTIGDIAFVIDTSGSMTPNLLRRMVSETKAANEHLSVVVVEADAGIERVYRFDGKLPGGGVQGRGGTDFTEVSQALGGKFRPDAPRQWKQLLGGVKAAVYLTDAYMGDPGKPPIPVMWLLTNKHGEPPAWVERKIVLPSEGEE